jgi:hypothetical protein
MSVVSVVCCAGRGRCDGPESFPERERERERERESVCVSLSVLRCNNNILHQK